ncbi:hypothetical protein HMPREF2532_04584 [Bacteroides ovatus]|nr:hypothetical protein HMPREF2532_04584 [Bacteroides ovatus]
MLSLATTHYYVAFISFSYLYYFFDCLMSFRLTVVELTPDNS